APDRRDGRGDPLRRGRRGAPLGDRRPGRRDPRLPRHARPSAAGGGAMTASARPGRRPDRFSSVPMSRLAVDVAVLGALFVLALLGFQHVYGGVQYLVTGIMALVLGTLIALIGAR